MNELLTSGWVNVAGFVAVAGFLWQLHRDIAGIHRNMGNLQERIQRDIGDLRERMARLEGLFEGFAGRKETPAGQ